MIQRSVLLRYLSVGGFVPLVFVLVFLAVAAYFLVPRNSIVRIQAVADVVRVTVPATGNWALELPDGTELSGEASVSLAPPDGTSADWKTVDGHKLTTGGTLRPRAQAELVFRASPAGKGYSVEIFGPETGDPLAVIALGNGGAVEIHKPVTLRIDEASAAGFRPVSCTCRVTIGPRTLLDGPIWSGRYTFFEVAPLTGAFARLASSDLGLADHVEIRSRTRLMGAFEPIQVNALLVFDLNAHSIAVAIDSPSLGRNGVSIGRYAAGDRIVIPTIVDRAIRDPILIAFTSVLVLTLTIAELISLLFRRRRSD